MTGERIGSPFQIYSLTEEHSEKRGTLSHPTTSLPTIKTKDLAALFKQLIISQRESDDEKSRLDTATQRNCYFLACPKPKAHQSRS